jgi:hypothetical protein
MFTWFLGSRMMCTKRKPLGAHEERILVAMKENMAVFVLQTKSQTVYAFPALEIRHS